MRQIELKKLMAQKERRNRLYALEAMEEFDANNPLSGPVRGQWARDTTAPVPRNQG